VPVETNAAALFLDYVFHKTYDSSRAVGRRMSDSVANANSLGATLNCGGVERADRLRFRAGCVFGDVHDRQALAHRKSDGVFSHLQQFFKRPVFSKKSNG